MLDLTHPDAVAWLRARLHALQADDGVDGFKFDAGDLRHYRSDDVSASAAMAVDQCEAWATAGRGVRVQRAPRLLEDGRPAARPAAARQTADLGRRRSGLADSRVHRAGSDRSPLQLPGHDRRRRSGLVRRRRADRPGTLRPVRPVRRPVPDDAVLAVAGSGARRPAPRCGQGGRTSCARASGRSYGGWSSTPPTPATRSSGRSRSTTPATNPSMINSCSARTSCALRSSRQEPRADRSYSLRVAGEAGPVSGNQVPPRSPSTSASTRFPTGAGLPG